MACSGLFRTDLFLCKRNRGVILIMWYMYVIIRILECRVIYRHIYTYIKHIYMCLYVFDENKKLKSQHP